MLALPPTRGERPVNSSEGRPAQAGAEGRTQRHVRRPSRQRAHSEMLTVAIRGPLAAKMRGLAEAAGLSLAKLLSDMMLVYEEQVDAAYESGISLAQWLDHPDDGEAQ